MLFTAAEIARRVEGEVVGDGSIQLTGFAAADNSRPGDLTFAENESYFARAEESPASAILVGDGFSSTRKVLIRVNNARIAYAKVLPLFFPPEAFAPEIHSSAVIAPSAQIDATAYIGPHCAVGERVRIGPRAVLEGGNHVGADCELGSDVHLFPRVTLYPRTRIGNRVSIHAGTVVGSDGFGYVLDKGAHRKVQQIGNVVIHDDVEIGANVTVDRGALGSTIVGKGAKIDNLVQIGHNVVVGEHSILVAQVGIAGSTKLGNYVTAAGQVGIAGHLNIGHRVILAAQAGVMNNVPEGEQWWGTPAQPAGQLKRIYVTMQRLPELLQRVNELEKRLQELTGRTD